MLFARRGKASQYRDSRKSEMDQDVVRRDNPDTQSSDVGLVTRNGCWGLDAFSMGIRGARKANGKPCRTSQVQNKS